MVVFFHQKKQSTCTDICVFPYWFIFQKVILNMVRPVVLFFLFQKHNTRTDLCMVLYQACVFTYSQWFTISSSPNLHGLYRWTKWYFSKWNNFVCFFNSIFLQDVLDFSCFATWTFTIWFFIGFHFVWAFFSNLSGTSCWTYNFFNCELAVFLQCQYWGEQGEDNDRRKLRATPG